MSLLLRRLLSRYFTLGVGPEDEPDAPAADAGGADEGSGNATLDDLIDAADIEEDPEPAESPALKSARERAERAERALDERRAPPAAAPASRGDPVAEQEDRELAQLRQNGADANAIAGKEWQINANRTLRATQANANQILSEARDVADRAAFERLETTKPKFFKRYGSKVEQAIAEARANGQAVPPRLVVLQLMVGRDLVEGKIGAQKKKAAAAEPAADTRVPRGRSPVLRSDVGQRGKLSDREARRKRLEGQQL